MFIVKLLLQIVGWIIFLALWIAIIAVIVEIVKKIIDIFRGKSSGCDCGTKWFEDYMRRNS